MELDAKIDNKIFSVIGNDSDSNVYTVKLSWSDGGTFVIRDNYQPVVYIVIKDSGKQKRILGNRVGYNLFNFSIDVSTLNSSSKNYWVILDVGIEIDDDKRLIANPETDIEMYERS